MHKVLVFFVGIFTRLEDFLLTTFLSTLLIIFLFFFFVFFTKLKTLLSIDLAGFSS